MRGSVDGYKSALARIKEVDALAFSHSSSDPRRVRENPGPLMRDYNE
jgi:hypothetical protein